MLSFRLAAQAHSARLACNALDISRVQELGPGKCRLQFNAESGGGANEIEGDPYEVVLAKIIAGKTEESAIYAAAYKAKQTLEAIATTVTAAVQGEVEKLVVKKLETDIGRAVEKRLDMLSAADDAAAGAAFGEEQPGKKEKKPDGNEKNRKGG